MLLLRYIITTSLLTNSDGISLDRISATNDAASATVVVSNSTVFHERAAPSYDTAQLAVILTFRLYDMRV